MWTECNGVECVTAERLRRSGATRIAARLEKDGYRRFAAWRVCPCGVGAWVDADRWFASSKYCHKCANKARVAGTDWTRHAPPRVESLRFQLPVPKLDVSSPVLIAGVWTEWNDVEHVTAAKLRSAGATRIAVTLHRNRDRFSLAFAGWRICSVCKEGRWVTSGSFSNSRCQKCVNRAQAEKDFPLVRRLMAQHMKEKRLEIEALANYVRASNNPVCRAERLRTVTKVLRSAGWSEARINEWIEQI